MGLWRRHVIAIYVSLRRELPGSAAFFLEASYNINSFDCAFIKFRMMIKGLSVAHFRGIYTKDMMKVLFPFGMKFRSKDAVCEALAIKSENNLTGKDNPGL